MSRLSGFKVVILAATLACLGALGVLGVAVATELDNILPGVRVLGSDLSGMTREQTYGKLLLLEKDIVMNTPLFVKYGERRWRLEPAQVGITADRDRIINEAFSVGRRGSIIKRWHEIRLAQKEGIDIPFYITIDHARLDQELKRISSEITIPPRDAQLKINPDETVEVIPSEQGISGDIEKIYRDIVEVYKNLDKKIPEVELSLVKSDARVTTREVMDMGINGLLAAYTTFFDYGDADRSYNIKVAAAAMDGHLLPPGETFSFNNVVGPRSTEAGYKNAKVIVNNELVDGTGGGVCQVSTTLYNAVLLANLEVVNRSNHSIPVSYVPPGRDATVSYNHIDFQFKNVTPYYLYLKTYFNPGRITVKIYGNTGYRREVTIKTTVVESQPYKELSVQDPGLKPGETRVKRKGSPGLRINTHRVIWENGTASTEFLSTSVYDRVDQLTLTGVPDKTPGNTLPAGDENIKKPPEQAEGKNGGNEAGGDAAGTEPADDAGKPVPGSEAGANGAVLPPAQPKTPDKKEDLP